MKNQSSAYPMGSSLSRGCDTQATPCFQPSQIVGLEHETGCLYAEVVQIIASRQSCWVRPLVLVLRSMESQTDNDRLPGENSLSEKLEYYDLRQDSDLLLPLTLFQVALDVEVLPWLANLYTVEHDTATQSDRKVQAHQRFRAFIQQVWQAHPEVFRDASRLGKT